MKKQFASITIIVLLLLIAIFGLLGQHNNQKTPNKNPNSALPTATLKIKDQILKVEVANTPQTQEHGLSDRASLPQDHGMLFDFTQASEKQPEFWMKDMRFNLDFIWIAKNKIIGINQNVPAPTKPTDPLPTYRPPGDIDYELEVNAGWSSNHNILVGDSVEIIKD
jgi:uncharacterized membrane protein (UPF0127 family)